MKRRKENKASLGTMPETEDKALLKEIQKAGKSEFLNAKQKKRFLRKVEKTATTSPKNT